MLKMVLDDYRMEFPYLLKRKYGMGLFDCVGLFGMSCLSLLLLVEKMPVSSGRLIWCVSFLAVVWGSEFIGSLYPNTVGKMFYLLPVSAEDRKKYIRTGYWFRVLFLTALLLVVLFIGMVCVDLEIGYAGQMLFHFFLMMCIINTYAQNGIQAGDMTAAKKMGVSNQRNKAGCVYVLFWEGTFASLFLLYAVMSNWLNGSAFVKADQAEVWGNSLMFNTTFCTLVCITEVIAAGVVCVRFWQILRGECGENCN